ncbi:nitric oxide dioxygenase [bacterium SCN 62-11]|nr:MAG: nitric oxide dioxygenase [bacterium SCN 62-11]
MLTDQTMTIVKSTAPILEEHGEQLTRHFYRRMFQHNPEVAPFFNPAHQSAGNQQRALAAAITAYAANIDNLEVLGGAVELIAQKHASLMIKPEHYPIVGANLLASIREVLGEGASDEVLNAWAEAYGFLADILMGREQQIYRESAQQVGGWEGFKAFRVLRKEPESTNITSFYLTPVDGSKLPVFKAGQYTTVRIASAEGQTTMRNYSLSDQPGRPHFRISVKRESGINDTPDGYVSNWLHDRLEVGMQLELAPPCGEFFLDTSEKHARPLVLLAAGVGITPIMSILLSALEATPEREIIVIHGCLNEAVQAFGAELEALSGKHPNLKVHFRYSDKPDSRTERRGNASTGLVDAALIESMLSGRDADYYFCGPQPFMVGIYHQLLRWGLPPAQVHFEFFGPRQALV